MDAQDFEIRRTGRPTLRGRETAGRGPAIMFLPGYASDMSGSKACALFDWAAAEGRSCILFDYAGCGTSDGDFAQETLETWLGDALDVVAARAPAGPLILVGSSMGGWLMLLAALRLGARVAGLVGIAAAPDFTRWGYSAKEVEALHRDGRLLQDNPYGPEATLTTLALWQSGERNLLLDGPIAIDCPVTLLHGQRDEDVPWANALRLAEALRSDAVRLVLVKDGDHRLSRPADIALLLGAVAAFVALPPE